jgi:N-acetylmuramoyl-L-alanine amidase
MLKNILVLLVFLSTAGCATLPTPTSREIATGYNLHGITYLALAPLCKSKGINWDYDTFTRTVVLRKEGHRINLRVGDNLILVDGVAEYLHSPVEIYAGAVVVPYRFKEKILDGVFKIPPLAFRQPRAIWRLKTVVIDAGHGGKDPGTIGKTGIKEKYINLDIAKRLAKLLKDNGINVVLTRAADVSVPLSRRVAMANNARAKLFISIHTNANRVRSLKGFEVYYISPKANDTKRALVAAQEAVLNLDNRCFASSSLNLKAILWDLFYTHSRAESIEFARSLCRVVNRDVDVKVLGVKNANFFVLRGVRMPAVLVEIGFLSNPSEERLLKNNFYRQEIAESLLCGIDDYAEGLPVMEAAR